ncbi:MAG TPA: glycosyltransferase [Gemmatimonadaceae bacterium]|nr:glycosyltransferase [Gemmatimonadaceae bacterium]
MICILHGWLLEGSGSNLWTRSIVTALARAGETVHLVCQENHPSLYEAIAEAWKYDSEGNRVQTLNRETPFPGKCILHQPWIGDTLPVFVWDKYEEYNRVVPMIELPDDEIESYIERNYNVVLRVVKQHGITAMHANHAVLMPVVAQRVRRETQVPFTIMPHGSDIEYAVKKDERFARYAASAFSDAAKVFVIGAEMRQRVNTVFASVPDVDRKCVELHLGVDTAQFDPVAREERPGKIASLHASLVDASRGKSHEQSQAMFAQLSDDLGHDDLAGIFLEASRYDGKLPDVDLEEKLRAINWTTDPTLLFTGRIISVKGPQAVLAALPLILARVPELRLILVGHGPLREPMEAFVWALEHGNRRLAESIVAWGRALEGDPEGAAGTTELSNVAKFYSLLESRGELDRYFEIARQRVRSRNVVFTGYLTHNELRFLFPCGDVGVFPSIVREAGPLVFLEALASGCFPLGTYFGGMAASIDAVSKVVPPDVAAVMRLDPDDTVNDIVRHVPPALDIGVMHKDVLARLARDRYDWTSVATTFARELGQLGAVMGANPHSS